MDWSDQLKFKELTDFLERLVRAEKSSRSRHLQRFLGHCRTLARKHIGGDSMFPVMRLLLPGLDKERGTYNIKESVLADLYVQFLQLGKNSADALKLKNYRNPKAAQDDAGDFASVLYTVMQQRSYASTDISCAYVNMRLDDIVRVTRTDGRKEVGSILKDLFLKMDAVQQKWFVRILLKDLRISMGNSSVLGAFHRDGRELYEVNANLRKVCEQLRDPDLRLNEIEIELFTPFKPQLADRIPISKLDKVMKGKTWYVETKYDGERMQAHMKGNLFRFFSRNGNDFTEQFGEDVWNKEKFSSHLGSSLSSEVESIILDGEICAWNHQTQKIIQKSQQQDIRNIRSGDPNFHQCLVIYDICYLNGKVLTSLPLSERIGIYKRVVKEKPGRILLSHRFTVNSKAEVIKALNEAIDNREEGLVLKDPERIYKPNARSGSGWIKLKPEYQNHLMDQLDLLVLGGYFGTGKGGGQITSFLLGLADRSGLQDSFLTFCRVSSGFSNSELEDLVRDCGKPTKTPSSDVRFGRDKPDVWFDPRSSRVVQVNAAEIIKSDSYATDCTLRFPRVETVRQDRDFSNCTTVQEMAKIRDAGDGKLFGGVHLLDTEAETPRKRAKVATVKPALGAAYKHQDYTQERIETFHLKNKVLVVEPCSEVEFKHKLERIIAAHGGTVEQNVRIGHTFCYVQTAGTIKLKNVVDQGLLDVVKSSWILDCEHNFRSYGPHDVVFATKKTKEIWKGKYDEFGDSYTEPATAGSLSSSLKVVKNLGLDYKGVSGEEVQEILSDLSNYKYFLFKDLTFCFDYPTSEDTKELDIALVRFYGGDVVEDSSKNISHLVLLNPSLDSLNDYKEKRRNLSSAGSRIFKIISPEWICVSVGQLRLQPEVDFFPISV